MKDKLNKLLDNAYGVYSGVKVSAVIVDKNKNEFYGVNVENSAYPSGICAERNAIFNAVTNGVKPYELQEVHIGSNLKEKVLYPCGACLQVILEFLTGDSKIFLYGENEVVEHKLKELIPHGVTKESFEWK